MLDIRLLPDQERKNIRKWPKYSYPFDILDYSLREGGWLDVFANESNCIKFGFYKDNKLIAFSLLDRDMDNGAEFYVAVKSDELSKGYGKKVCLLTLEKAFNVYNLKRIFLKVRINHTVGIKLYEHLGFKYVKNCRCIYNNIETDFFYYELLSSSL